MKSVLLGALVATLSVSAIANATVLVQPSNRPVVVRPGYRPTQPNYRPGPVVVRPGPVVVRPNPTYRPPVVIQPRVVYRGPRVVYQPRYVPRTWVYRPGVVVVRPYAYVPITPIYIPYSDTTYNQTLLQGELWPANTEQMSYFTHYTVSIDRNTLVNSYGSYSFQTIVTMHPQIVCQDNTYGCAGVPTPPTSRLVVTSDNMGPCGVRQILASAADQYSPIRYIELFDYSRFNCDYNGSHNELVATRVVHLDGYEETNLRGNVTYHRWY